MSRSGPQYNGVCSGLSSPGEFLVVHSRHIWALKDEKHNFYIVCRRPTSTYFTAVSVTN